ncbi:MAG: lipopolysaccharide heptosyltransferase II [Planctomycetes bacterium]|nr:lipopolysaccharide heptosyltransferase II [Planctomycetota bacterium]
MNRSDSDRYQSLPPAALSQQILKYEHSSSLRIPETDVLVCAPNWFGDSIISMTAVQAFKAKIPNTRITVMAPQQLACLWWMNLEVDAVIPMKKTVGGILEAAKIVKAGCFDEAFVLPHSLRAALIPFLKRVPVRWGLKGYHRGPLLTHPLTWTRRNGRNHQIFEYLTIMGLTEERQVPLPRLVLSNEAVTYCWKHLLESGWIFENPADPSKSGSSVLVGLIPGAARGKAKQWPPEYFAETGRELVRETGCKILVFGTSDEISLCRRVTDRIGTHALNLAGKTSIPELAAMLSFCKAVVTNDSGGMHLAAAVGTPVVAIFGATDPNQTAPLGSGNRIVQPNGVQGSRRIKRNDSKAEKALCSIKPGIVSREVTPILASAYP